MARIRWRERIRGGEARGRGDASTELIGVGTSPEIPRLELGECVGVVFVTLHGGLDVFADPFSGAILGFLIECGISF
jgi:hypothetical protein